MENNFMTRSAVARELEISESCVGVWSKNGKLPAVKTTNGKLIFREVDILKIKAARTKTEKAPFSK
jgi:predicted site-specific integrase-resolvase